MKRIALIATAGLVLAGCGGRSHASSPTPRAHYPVVVRSPIVEAKPSGVHMRGLARLVSPTRLAIATTGSSSCPSVPDELVFQSRHTMRIHLTIGSWDGGKPVAHPPPGGVCTADLGTTAMLVAIDPTLIDVHRTLTVLFFSGNSKTPFASTVAPL